VVCVKCYGFTTPEMYFESNMLEGPMCFVLIGKSQYVFICHFKLSLQYHYLYFASLHLVASVSCARRHIRVPRYIATPVSRIRFCKLLFTEKELAIATLLKKTQF
jgi:hypothetical protein